MYIKGACFFFFVFFETLLRGFFFILRFGGIFVHYFSITNDFLRALTPRREREREREKTLSCVLGGDDDDDDGRTEKGQKGGGPNKKRVVIRR